MHMDSEIACFKDKTKFSVSSPSKSLWSKYAAYLKAIDGVDVQLLGLLTHGFSELLLDQVHLSKALRGIRYADCNQMHDVGCVQATQQGLGSLAADK